MKEKFRPSDYRFILTCLVLFGAAIFYSAHNFYRAFPEASIDFRVDRDGGRSLAEQFLAGRQYTLAGYRQASRFDFDDNAKTFLEREAGLEQANLLMSSRIRMWRWQYRWFQPRNKEEYRADVTVTGDIAGFAHELPEDAARPGATPAEARTLAEDFLRATMHRDPAGLEFVEVNETARSRRNDRVFTWKDRDFNLHDATYRVEVTMLGSEVGGFRQYLKVPEQWQRDFERLRSKNTIAETVDSAVLVALLAGMLVLLVLRTRRQDVRWRGAAIVGVIGTVLALCAQLNSLPLSEFGYPTTDSYSSFLSREFINALLTALASGAFLFLMTAGSEPLYRETYRGQISLGNLFGWRGLRTKRFFKGAILGITLTAIFIAYQTVFYIVASRLGAWAPADVPYSDELNTRFPWVFVLFGGFFPAVFEEFVFRMFAIPFLRRLVRWLPLALVLAGFIWGFGHAGYPNEPFYIRGVEVGIGGVALGIIMLRWGILPTLVWHYSVDAMYSAMLLLRSHSLYFKLSGAASAGVIVLPVIAALVAYRVRGGFEPDQGLLNADEPAPVEPAPIEVAPAADAPPASQNLTARWRLAALAVFAAGLLAFLIPGEHFGDSPRYNLTADQSRAPADSFLRDQSLDPSSFRHVTYPSAHWGGDDSMAGKYFLERESMASASKMFEQYRPIQVWATRYYRSLDQEEVLVTVHPESGRILGYSHTLPEDRPGADLTEDAARQIADAFAGARGIELATMELKESTSELKKARRDHTLVWEAPQGDSRNLDEAHYRVEIKVAGGSVSSWRSFWKLPETFTRSREQRNFIAIAIVVMLIVVLLTGLVWTVWQLVRNIRQGLVRWKAALPLAAVATLLMAVATLLNLPQTYQSYPTAIPLATFTATLYIGVAITIVGGFLLMGAVAGLLTSSFPDSIDAFRAASRRWTGVDAACAALAAVGLVLGINRLNGLLNAHFHAQAILSLGPPGLIATASPAAAALAGAVSSSALLAAFLAIIVLIARRLPRWIVAPLALPALLAAVPQDVRTPAELALQYGMVVVTGAAAVAFCWCFARRNYVAYALIFFALSLRTPLAELFGNNLAGAHLQGCIVAAVLALVAIWVVLPARRPVADEIP